MSQPAFYSNLAPYYDLIYSKKNYEKEASQLKRLIAWYKRSPGNSLLDVACGTGRHLSLFKNEFSCTGVDISKEMLKIARQNIPEIAFKQADMTKLNLKQKFDIITCLFSSIGYLRTESNLKEALLNFSKHLNPGGVVIIEPWLPAPCFRLSAPWTTKYEGKNIKIVRKCTPETENGFSILNMDFTVEKNGKVQTYNDKHILGFFSAEKTLTFMCNAGLEAIFLSRGLCRDSKGLFVGIKPGGERTWQNFVDYIKSLISYT